MVRSDRPLPDTLAARDIAGELIAERHERRLWETRYGALERAVLDAGHDPYVPCALAGDGCTVCATVRRARALHRVGGDG